MIKLIELHRLTGFYGTSPTLGVLMINGMPEFLTLEPPFKDNERNISCIPEGEYTCVRVQNRITNGGTKIPNTFEVEDVSGRDGILFHVGNTEKDTQGCILIGSEFGVIKSEPAILRSSMAFGRFMSRMAAEDMFTLYINSIDSES